MLFTLIGAYALKNGRPTQADLLGAASNFGYITGISLATTCVTSLTKQVAYRFFKVSEEDIKNHNDNALKAHRIAFWSGSLTAIGLSLYAPSTAAVFTFKKTLGCLVINILALIPFALPLAVMEEQAAESFMNKIFNKIEKPFKNEALYPLLDSPLGLMRGAAMGFLLGLAPRIIGKSIPFGLFCAFSATQQAFKVSTCFKRPAVPNEAPQVAAL